MNADGMSKRQRASEESFHKFEQERMVQEYLAKARKSGRSLSTAGRFAPEGAGILPQIAAQYLRAADAEAGATRLTHQQHYSFVPGLRNGPKPAVRQSPLVEAGLLGNSFSLGRSKWEANGIVERTSIWDIKKGMELAQGKDLPKHVLQQAHRMTAPPVRSVLAPPETMDLLGGLKVRVMPEYTPGRALLWGSVLAVWGTAAIVMRAARALDIRDVDEVKEKVQPLVRRSVQGVPEMLQPVKEFLSGQAYTREQLAYTPLVGSMQRHLKPGQ